ncbi:hypothetical protein [Gemmata sp.]|uniref:hypothetical protein n=1 Tax=Gemmata sp. TaxID=1914242 RepID=UPI003F6F2C5D
MTSDLRDGNTPWTHDLPVLPAGGFRHGRHLAFNTPLVEVLAAAADLKGVPAEKKPPMMGVNQTPLCNLYASMSQRAGVPAETSGTGTGTLTGLDHARAGAVPRFTLGGSGGTPRSRPYARPPQLGRPARTAGLATPG